MHGQGNLALRPLLRVPPDVTSCLTGCHAVKPCRHGINMLQWRNKWRNTPPHVAGLPTTHHTSLVQFLVNGSRPSLAL